MNRFLPRRSPNTEQGFGGIAPHGRVPWPHRNGFTLVELLVGLTIFIVLMALLMSIVSNVSQMWQRTENQKNRQQAARIVLDRLTRDLESALFPMNPKNTNSLQFSLNPAQAPRNPNAAFWQTVLSGDTSGGDIGEVGYFVRWKTDSKGPRSELCRIEVPATNANSIFQNPQSWLTTAKISEFAPDSDTNSLKGVLVDNVVGFWITLYYYDAQGNLKALPSSYHSRLASIATRPALAKVSLAVMDSGLFQRLADPSDITKYYPDYKPETPEAFMAKMPDPFRAGVQMFSTQVKLEAVR